MPTRRPSLEQLCYDEEAWTKLTSEQRALVSVQGSYLAEKGALPRSELWRKPPLILLVVSITKRGGLRSLVLAAALLLA
jgi:hypothetical protein